MITIMNWRALVVGALAVLSSFVSTGQQPPTRGPDEDVRSPHLRTRAGLAPNKNLLFNGWGVTPAGKQIPISDMALKMVISPDKKVLLAASAGFNDTGLTLFDVTSRKVSQFLPLSE